TTVLMQRLTKRMLKHTKSRSWIWFSLFVKKWLKSQKTNVGW
ncbi:periplasmic solute binding family protein, partial [Vibrio harveyi]